MTGEARADAIYTLPRIPRRAFVHGAATHWRAGLEARGVEVVEVERDADLVVTHDPTATSDAAALIIDGPRRVARSTASGRAVTRLTSVPPHGDPGILINLGHRRAASHALTSLSPPERSRRARNAVAAMLLRARVLPPVLPLLTTATREPGRSAFDLGPEAGLPAHGEWYLTVAAGSIVRRSALHVFAPGSTAPDVIVKLSRVRDLPVQFDRDEAALAVVRRAGGCVAAHAPRLLYRFTVDGRHASVETAARGACLRQLLAESGSTDAVRLAGVVARWLDDVARQTAHDPSSLGPHRARLASVAQRQVGADVADRLLARVADAPAVLTHGEVFEDHVFVDDGRITVIDWEHTQEHGFPVWDLVFFASNVLSAIDGVGREEPRDRYVERLFTGRAPSSPVLFRWLRDAAAALDIAPDALAALVALYWIERSELSRAERLRAESVSDGRIPPSWLETTAERWFTNRELGEEFRAWQ